MSYYPRLITRLRALANTGMTAAQIADQLHAEGFRPPKRHDRFGTQGIQELLRRHGLPRSPGHTGHPPRERLGEHEWRLPDLAAALDMPPVTLHTWLRRGWVHGHRDDTGQRAWILHADPDELAHLRQRRQRPNGYYTRHRFLDNQHNPPSPNEKGTRR